MSSWGNTDNAANTPLWATMMVNLAPTRANSNTLFSNTAANTFITDQTVGLFGVSPDEIIALNTTNSTSAHTGWVLRRTGQGCRAGRVTEEVLVALSTMNGDYENATYPNTSISITTQPTTNTVNSGTGNTITFRVKAATSNANANLSYVWQYNTLNGSLGWTLTTAGGLSGLFTGNTSNVLVANAATTAANTYVVRAIVSSTYTTSTKTSSNAEILIM